MSENSSRHSSLARLTRFLAQVLVGVGLLVLAVGVFRQLRSGPPPAKRAIARAERPVLLITVDTTRPDRLEPYGAENVATPSLQRLARGGITFEHAWSVAPITLVAHTSILSGLDPPRHGVRNNGIHYVPDQIETLAERLKDEGYATAAFVSAAVLEKRYNLSQGFEVYDDDLSEGRERSPRMVADRPAEFTVHRASAWLDTLAPDQPYFLWVHFYDPHATYSPPPPYRDDYRERLYDGEIAYMDAEIGRLLRHPRVDEKALIHVIGDHGESLGEHGEQTHALLAYDSTLHVPWILKIPGGPRGLRLEPSVGQVDLTPTVLDLLGFRVPDGLAGRSVVPLIEGRAADLARGLYAETWLPFYTYGWAKLQVWRQGRFKWIEAPTPELYDTLRDPRELADVAGLEPGTAHDMARDLREFLATVGDGELETNLALDTDALERLRGLGYLSVGSGADLGQGERPDPKEMIDLHVGLERARTFIRDRFFAQAEDELERVLRRDTTNLAAMIDLATVKAEQDELEEAIRITEQALKVDPRYPRLYLLMAGFEARRGEPKRALELYDRALELDPQALDARMKKAAQLHRMRRFEESKTLLDAALVDHPDSPPLNTLYAQLVEIRQEQLEAAESRLRTAIARDPFLVSGWRFLGDTLEKQRRDDEALAAYREGLKRRGDDEHLHTQAGLLLARLRGGAEAEAHLREALRLAEKPRVEVRVALGAWLAEHQRFEEALAEYEKVLAAQPRNPDALNNRAIALYQTGRLAEAEQQLLELVQVRPRHADALNNLAAIAFSQQRFAVAGDRARKALAVMPEMAEAWNNLGLALAGQGRPNEARKAYERALVERANYWQARLNLGLLLSQLEQWEAAARALGEVVRQAPSIPDSHLELGHLYAGPLSQPKRARDHYNAFLRQAPQHPQATEVRQRLADLSL